MRTLIAFKICLEEKKTKQNGQTTRDNNRHGMVLGFPRIHIYLLYNKKIVTADNLRSNFSFGGGVHLNKVLQTKDKSRPRGSAVISPSTLTDIDHHIEYYKAITHNRVFHDKHRIAQNFHINIL